ncbi:MAG: hypothetical protein EA407_05145 [Rhodobacteraceae bacterium]|nr:MAG: hypothetical protein EA407_05145 [Paracoccaceae bacterium]
MKQMSFSRTAWIRLHEQLRGEKGSISVETVLILPFVFWALMASFTFTDAFRAKTGLQRAVFTTSDLVSRASANAVTPEFLRGTHDFLSLAAQSPDPVYMRMSLIGWDVDAEAHRVVWSFGERSGGRGRLTDEWLADHLAQRLPMISLGETVLVTEGWLDYRPPFTVGLGPRRFTELAVSRPRFAPGIRFDDPDAPPPPTAWCEFIVDGCGM